MHEDLRSALEKKDNRVARRTLLGALGLGSVATALGLVQPPESPLEPDPNDINSFSGKRYTSDVSGVSVSNSKKEGDQGEEN